MPTALDLTLTTPSGEETTRFPLSQQFTAIGRSPENDICITDMCISRKHATISRSTMATSSSMTTPPLERGSTGWLRLVSGGRGAVLRYDDVRARLPCIPTTALHPHDCMASLSRHTCLLSHSQDTEFGVAPDLERTTKNPFGARATFRVTISSCTPLCQRSPLIQMSAPIPLAVELDPNQGAFALPNSSASEAMEPQPKRLRPNDSTAAPDAPPAAVLPSPAADLSVVAPPPAAEPLNEAPGLGDADVLSQHWHVFGNDPNDAAGIRSVLLAEHSRGKPEAMVRAAFSHLSDEDGEVASFVQMDASNVFRNKKGGKKDRKEGRGDC